MSTVETRPGRVVRETVVEVLTSDGVRQLGIWLVLGLPLGYLYTAFHPLAGPAIAHARTVLNAERAIGVNVELLAQHLTASAGLGSVMRGVYLLSQLVVSWVVLIALFAWRRAAYRLLRDLYLATNAVALVVFHLWPVASPAASGDGVAAFVVKNAPAQVYDRYAAMPSLHVACAVAVAMTLTATFRSRWRYLAWLWPMLVTVAVVGTGNHFVLDAVAGVAVTILCALARLEWVRSWGVLWGRT